MRFARPDIRTIAFTFALATTSILSSLPPSFAQTPALGLLFDAGDIPTMRQNAASPVFADFWDGITQMDASSDGNFMREAFVYVLTGEAARGENAKLLVLEMAEKEYWNNFADGDQRLGFLQDGRITAWMALAYDWLYDLFSEAERDQIRKAIAEKGCVPLYRSLHGMRYPETVVGWHYADYAPPLPRIENVDMTRWPHILGHNNFRAIINGGLTLGLLVLDGHDDRVPEWREMVLDSIERFNALFKDDGSYDEAVAYLNYAMTYEVYAMEAAKRKMGVDFFDTANFPGMMDFVLAMYMPTNLYGNSSLTFGDAGNSLRSEAGFWVARNSRDGRAQYTALNYSDHDLFSLLYYDPTIVPEAPDAASHFYESDLDWIVSRSGYGMDDFVVGMRSGGPSNHEHGDRNSIELKAYGEILIADHRRLTYFSEDPEWMMRGALGHNTILIDGLGSQYHNGEEGTNESKSHARIVRSGHRAGYDFWASDATQAYQLINPDVTSVTRSVVSFPSAPAVIVLDRVDKADEPSRISSRWQVENEADGLGALSIGDGSFTISRPGGRLYAAVTGDSDVSITEGSFASANKDYPFVWAEVADADSLLNAFRIMVGVPLRPEEPDPVVDFDRDGDRWVIHIQKAGSSIDVNVIDGGTLPEFEVIRNDFR